jgi:hypothetical protein
MPSPPPVRSRPSDSPPTSRAQLLYHDPLDRIWLATARLLGFSIARTRDAYATSDGKGQILIGTAETLDGDDSLAQLILHELCHAITQAPEGLALPDWGLANTDDRDRDREHACLRLQARLLRTYGLERLLAPTTEYRTFYDALGDDPLMEAGGEGEDDPSVALARQAFARASSPPWHEPLDAALAATAALLRLVAPFEAALASTSADAMISLWRHAAVEKAG